jgi:GNAT superfamily N-acetyltransferase
MFQHPRAEEIDAHAARRLGCDAEHLRQPGTLVLPADEADVPRLLVFERGGATVICASRHHFDEIEAIAAESSGDGLGAEQLCERLADLHPAVISSERLLYLDPSRFRPVRGERVRQLQVADSVALTDLHRACPALEQRLANVSIDHPAVFGSFGDEGDEADGSAGLLAAASFIDSDRDAISDVGVLVHPEHRRRGHGQAVVTALSEWGLQRDRIVQYWHLEANTPSAAIADHLGFTEYARHTVVRLGGAKSGARGEGRGASEEEFENDR